MRERNGISGWVLPVVTIAALVVAPAAQAAATGGGVGKSDRDAPKAKAESKDEAAPRGLATPSVLGAAPKTAWTIGIGPALYSDIFQRTVQDGNSVGGTGEPSTERFGSSFVMNGSAWLLNTIAPDVRFGGALRWYGEYAGVTQNGNAQNFGQLFDLAAHGEYLIDNVYRDFGVLFGARLGGTALFPTTPGLDDDPNIDGPRFGFFGEPLAGIRWVVLPKLALRADTLVKFGRIYLYDTGQAAGGVVTSTASHLDQFQIQWSLGVEFMP